MDHRSQSRRATPNRARLHTNNEERRVAQRDAPLPRPRTVGAARAPRFRRRRLRFEQNVLSEGVYKVYAEGTNGDKGDTPLTQDTFTFVAHWRPTHMSIDVSVLPGFSSGMLAVANEWGGHTWKHIACTA